ncbi:hypothetical protein DXG03_005563 [Asterophora parasitica]|uniref:Glycoside hydrolase family 5 domain-containing protein n=1 Tax=Asterophora parasitica TaxID=117018 RepID=A0A9P7G1X9_9AGAR|nr:hypothetical protein DXG03_005563 [Asterophora parasitica]
MSVFYPANIFGIPVQKNYVLTVRAVEYLLGFPVPSLNLPAKSVNTGPGFNIANALSADLPAVFPQEVKNVLKESAPILGRIGTNLKINFNVQSFDPLITNFMDVTWQYNNPANAADAARGPQIYDNHLYYSFGGVADPNENAYLTHVCNLDRVAQAGRNRNVPLYFGEWALSTNFGASDAFLKKWADAQKRAYSADAGWIFWNFKIEISNQAGDTARQWSYVEGVRRGYLTRDPSKLNDPNVCAPYIRR